MQSRHRGPPSPNSMRKYIIVFESHDGADYDVYQATIKRYSFLTITIGYSGFDGHSTRTIGQLSSIIF